MTSQKQASTMARSDKFLVAFFLFLVFFWTLEPLLVFDLWFYIRMGEEIVSTQTIPHYETFLSTADSFEPFYDINPEWAMGVLTYLVHRFAGEAGLCVLKALLLTSIGLVILLACREAKVPMELAIPMTGLGLWVMRSRFLLRSVLVTDLCLGILVWQLLRAERGSTRSLPWIAFALLAILANFHTGGISALFLLGAWWLGLSLEKILGRDRGELSPSVVLTTAAAGFLGSLLRPGGWLMYPWIYEHMERKLPLQWVREWEPLADGWWFTALGPYLLLAIGGFLVNGRDRLRLPYLLVSLVYFAFAFRYNRALGELVPVVTPLIAILWVGPFEKVRVRRFPLFLGTVLTALLAFSLTQPRHYQLKAPSSVLPVVAVDYLEQHPPRGRLFNSYEFGGYLAFRHQPPFIHGITSIFPDQLLRDYVALHNDPTQRASLLDRYEIETMLLHYPTGGEQLLLDYLDTEPDWHLVYWDDACLLYFHGTPPTQPFKVRPASGRPFFDLDLGEATDELERHVERFPESLRPRLLLAKAYQEGERFEQALSLYSQIVQAHPRSFAAFFEQGQVLFGLQRLPEAARSLERAVALSPDSAPAHFNLAIVYVGLASQQPTHASSWLKKARSEARRSLELKPDFENARQLLEQLL